MALLSFRGASYAGVFTFLPPLTGEGCEAHGRILAKAAKLVEAGQLAPRLDERCFIFYQVADAHALVRRRSARGKVVVEVLPDCVGEGDECLRQGSARRVAPITTVWRALVSGHKAG